MTEPATAAGIPYEGTDCTPEEAVEAVEAVRATAARRRFWNRLSLWRSRIADAYWERRLGKPAPLHPVREIRLLDRLDDALADRRAARAAAIASALTADCQMIAPVCANCGREIDRTPEGWIHVR